MPNICFQDVKIQVYRKDKKSRDACSVSLHGGGQVEYSYYKYGEETERIRGGFGSKGERQTAVFRFR